MLKIEKVPQKYQITTMMIGIFLIGFIGSFSTLSAINPKDENSNQNVEASKSDQKNENKPKGTSAEASSTSSATASQEAPTPMNTNTATIQSPDQPRGDNMQDQNKSSQATAPPKQPAGQPKESQEEDKNLLEKALPFVPRT